MRLETKPMGTSYTWDESNISDLNWGESGLRIVVEFWSRTDPSDRRCIEYYWHGATRHRVLEESDLAHYWDNASYEKGHLLFQVLSGGWLSHANQENINIWFGQEWFLYTSNWSATVISSGEPVIRELK
jgi:hypothetical protein